MALRTLNRKQTKVARKVLRQGKRMDFGSKKERKRLMLAAIETGLVESHFRNLRGGSQDSAGWRQERKAYYRNPRNIRASSRRFFREGRHAYHGQGPGKLAQDIQQSGYGGRYKKVQHRAKKILRDYRHSPGTKHLP